MVVVPQEFQDISLVAFVLFVLLYHVAVGLWIFSSKEPYLTRDKRASYALIVLMSAAIIVVIEDDITVLLAENVKMLVHIAAYACFTIQIITTVMIIRKPEPEPENRAEIPLNLQDR